MVEVESYILDGVDEGGIKDVSYLINNYYLTYTLSANINAIQFYFQFVLLLEQCLIPVR